MDGLEVAIRDPLAERDSNLLLLSGIATFHGEGDEFDDNCDDDLEEEELAELEEISQFFSDRALQEITGAHDLSTVSFLEVKINSEDFTLRDLGTRLPNLAQLKLNNSNIPSVRDLGTSLTRLTVLWLSRCNVTELDGIAAFPCLRELYMAFNEVKDLSALCSCERLEVLDLEGNCIADISEVYFLGSCAALLNLTLEGNPIQAVQGYRRLILDALPNLASLDDVDRDTPFEEEDGSMGGGDAFAVNMSVESDCRADEERCTKSLSVSTPVKASGENDTELMIVHQGIKHARAGFDDVEFISNSEYECMAQRTNRPMSGRLGRRPMSASYRPASASKRPRDRPTSPSESVSSDDSGRRTYKPGTGSSDGSCGRVQAPLSGGSLSRDPCARKGSFNSAGGRDRAGSFNSGRPGSAGSATRPGSSSLRPGSSMGRPETSGGVRPGSARLTAQASAWAMRRSARQHEGNEETVASDLTFGTEEIFCGGLARGLRKRNVASNVAKYGSEAEQELAAIQVKRGSVTLTPDDIMEELRRWKIETANLALMPDDDLNELPPLKVGEMAGMGGGDRLELDAEGSRSASDDDDTDMVHSRDAVAISGEDTNANSDTESQAPTARANWEVIGSEGAGGRIAMSYKRPSVALYSRKAQDGDGRPGVLTYNRPRPPARASDGLAPLRPSVGIPP